MKIRNGFVSNSSSSSFVVAFKTQPTSAEHLREMLFGDQVYISAYDGPISTQTAAEAVWGDMQQQQHSPSREEIMEEVRAKAGWQVYKENNGYPEAYWKMSREERAPYEAERSRRTDILCEQMTDDFLRAAEGGRIYLFSYSDNDGPLYSTLEHGETFERLPHVTISNH